uniref:Mitochondrial-processing peptidase subunit alpha n=1 Tax=Ananas comosus var. bracteatus TaxID=296719 RepID=A0A6V7Q764_ANACO|nr:unnamed protein product [Ananas comosus var. bracteatus]
MGYSYDTLKAYMPQAVELLIDCIRNPMFLHSEVEEQLAKVKEEVREMTKDPQKFLQESLHLVGYSGALGNPLVAPETALERIDDSVVRTFYLENYTADRLVLAASGINHQDLIDIVEPLLCDLGRGPTVEVPKSAYVGGDFRHKADSETLMGGGGSFSSGGPGKGMHSRLLTELELTWAKNATKSAVLMNLESRAIVTEDIGRQILTYGCRKPVEHFLKCIDELNLNDLTTMAQRILSSPLTMACWGDVDSVPSYDSIGWRFQSWQW